jgi:hypothetical protein
MDLGFAVWGDYDSDGDLDLLFGGNSDAGFVTTIFRNDNGAFVDIHAGMLPVLWASAAWGDYDNDGDFDAIIIGYDPVAQTSRSVLYRNDNGTFTDSGATFHNLYLGTVAWWDYDNDGRLDVLMAGNETGIGDMLRLAHNSVVAVNTPPTSPANLTVKYSGASALLSWSAASDAETAAAALTYNVRVGTTPGGSEIVAPQSTATGSRLVPQMGNAQLRLNTRLVGLTPGATFYWSVQSVDNAFAASPFAAEASFVVPVPAQSVSFSLDSGGTVHGVWSGTPGATYRTESSSDLVHWTPVSSATVTNVAGTFEFAVTPPQDVPIQFYRAVIP